MKRYEDRKKEVVTARECVKVVCDMCGRVAEHPEVDSAPFEWGGIGYSGGELLAEYRIEGEYNSSKVDLCYECADWLLNQIAMKKLRREPT